MYVLASVPYGVILALNSPEMIQILLNWGEIKENSLDIYARTSNKTNTDIGMIKHMLRSSVRMNKARMFKPTRLSRRALPADEQGFFISICISG